jgi:hypothetical protein
MKQLFCVLTYILVSSTSIAQDALWSSHPDSSIFNSYTQREISVELFINESKGQRVLLYYYEHFSLRVNKFHEMVLGNPTVRNFILENFYPIAVDLDIDKMTAGASDVGRCKTYRKFLKEQTYYIEATPAFSVYNPAGILRGSKTFLKTTELTVQNVLEFLKKRLK